VVVLGDRVDVLQDPGFEAEDACGDDLGLDPGLQTQ
jgi:hypothetical protein